MSSRIFQGIIVQMKDATNRTIGIVDSNGVTVASSELSLIGSHVNGIYDITDVLKDGVAVVAGRTFKLVGGLGSRFDYAVFVDGTDSIARSLCIMACIAISEAKINYEEKHDKSAFVKNIITDNILPGDVYIHAKELHFIADAYRVVYLVRQSDKADVATIEVIRKLFPDKQTDFIISINETDIAVIKEVPAGIKEKEIQDMASRIEETIMSELSIKTVIGIGSVARHLRELADRYKEAQIAIEIGKVFEEQNTIINYENLGIGRLIYQLPTTLCEMFLSEVFKKNPIDSLDEETLGIITKFFENNLNISETSRKLFVHRNTLVYRLGKIKKLTGLDLREFDQAIVFKVALMVKKYLDSQKA